MGMKTSYYMKRICSNCQKDMGTKPTTDPKSHLELTHGICSKCVVILYADDFSPEDLKGLCNHE
jgi:hypothetical protein